MRPALILHGGAGTFPPDKREAARLGMETAARDGLALLRAGESALDIVELVVRRLEDDPVFNAGRGSALTAEGTVEMDALIVDGATGAFGAVAGITAIANPVTAARKVMTDTPHAMLAGPNATLFAHAAGLPVADLAYLKGDPPATKYGTVGCAAIDIDGHTAAATSTGGTQGKMAGRIGDSPLIGCGALAEDGVGAASATGHGESLMRIMAARTALDFLRAGFDANEAAVRTIAVLEERTGGRGGVIVVDGAGNTGFAFNTPHMAWGWVDETGEAAGDVA